MTQINDDPIIKLDELNTLLKSAGYEFIIRRVATKDVVAFDFGLVFTKDSNAVGLYVDDVLREVLSALANEHGQVLVKANWFSPDVIVVTPADNPDPLQNTEDTDTAAVLQQTFSDTPVSSQEAPGLTEGIDPMS